MLDRGSFVHALSLYSKALDDGQLDPAQRVAALNNRAVVYRRLGLFSRAIDDYNAGLAIVPDDSDLFFNRGLALLASGQPGLSSADLSQAISLGVDDAAAWKKALDHPHLSIGDNS